MLDAWWQAIQAIWSLAAPVIGPHGDAAFAALAAGIAVAAAIAVLAVVAVHVFGREAPTGIAVRVRPRPDGSRPRPRRADLLRFSAQPRAPGVVRA